MLSAPGSAAASIGDWVADASPDWDAAAVAVVRRAFIDTVGVTLLGSRMDATRIVARVELARLPPPIASLLGIGKRADVAAAALVNGTASHAALFDDNSAPMIAHPSGVLVSALMPLAQARRKTGRAIIDAYAVGFEVGVKLGRAVHPDHYERGWHATKTLGVLGATAACARLVGLDREVTTHAVGIAASLASGLRQNFGTMTMALHAGLAARDAVHAVSLAEAGLRSDPGSLDGAYGLFRAMVGRAATVPRYGEALELTSSGLLFKPYPSGAPTLAAVDAALRLRARLQEDLSRVRRITCLVHHWNAMTLRDEEPRDALQAKVNLRFCVATALVRGRLTWREFDEEAVADPAIRAMMARIDVAIADDLPDHDEFPAEVRVELADGATVIHRNDYPPGGTTRALDDEALVAKARDNAAAALDEASIRSVLHMLGTLERLDDVDALCRMMEGDANR